MEQNIQQLKVSDTNIEALISKLSAIRKGYMKDEYISEFVYSNNKKDVLINRGYWSRVQAIRQTVETFMQTQPNQAINIISLGAGLDTLYWLLQESEQYKHHPFTYIELDFPEVTRKKAQVIMKSKKLQEQLIDIQTSPPHLLLSSKYKLLSGDLTKHQEWLAYLQELQVDCCLPTLIFTECVLAYVDTQMVDLMFLQLNQVFNNLLFLDYEMFNPNDQFGKMMLHNFEIRGCPLVGISEYPTLDDQKQRFIKLGFNQVYIKDMLQIYNNYLDKNEKIRIQKCEFLDEFEEWNLIQQHYFVMIAKKFNDPDIKNLYEHIKL